jgi:hypothetical protein
MNHHEVKFNRNYVENKDVLLICTQCKPVEIPLTFEEVKGSIWELPGKEKVMIAFSGSQFHLLTKRMHHYSWPTPGEERLAAKLNDWGAIYLGNISEPKIRELFFN